MKTNGLTFSRAQKSAQEYESTRVSIFYTCWIESGAGTPPIKCMNIKIKGLQNFNFVND